jgi:hypothetical protein
MGEMNPYRILIGRPRHRWVENIKIDLGMDWTDLAQDRHHLRALV